MNYRALGRSGLKVSELCLGTMLFGSHTDEKTSLRLIDRARDIGVNFIDSADVYVRGVAEQIIARGVASDRHDWVIATKLAAPMTDSALPNRRGLSRKWILEEVENSLRRLNTDYIDILYVHREDNSTPIEETVRALGDLVRQGKIRYYGISNHQSWKLAEYSHLADRLGYSRPVASQLTYNIVNRIPEKEHFTIADYYGQGLVVYSPLARGVLTGKYDPNQPPPEGTRAGRQDRKMHQTEWRDESLHIAQEIKAHAESRGLTATEFALAWILNSANVSSVISGARTEEQWESYVRALEIRLTAEDEALVDSLVKPGYSSTHGYADPADTPPWRALRGEERAPSVTPRR